MSICEWCSRRLRTKTRGRPRRYCDATCRQRAYERRRLDRDYPEIMRLNEEARIHVREQRTPRGLRAAIERAERELLWGLARLTPDERDARLSRWRNAPSDRALAELRALIAEAWRR
jgi:hypothetical protein